MVPMPLKLILKILAWSTAVVKYSLYFLWIFSPCWKVTSHAWDSAHPHNRSEYVLIARAGFSKWPVCILALTDCNIFFKNQYCVDLFLLHFFSFFFITCFIISVRNDQSFCHLWERPGDFSSNQYYLMHFLASNLRQYRWSVESNSDLRSVFGSRFIHECIEKPTFKKVLSDGLFHILFALF